MGAKGFWEAASARPEHPAIITESGTVTRYGALRERVDRLSHGLRARGVGVGDTVAVLLPNSLELLALELATLQIGAYFTPVNRHLTGAETAYILGNCGARLLVAHERYADAARQAADEAGLAASGRVAVGEIEGFGPLVSLEDGISGSGPVPYRTAGSQLFYSSGTTGRPKGIRRELTGLSPESEFGAQASTMLGLLGVDSPDEVLLTVSPLYHSAPNGIALCALHSGQTVVLAERFDPRHSLELAARHGTTYAFLVPTMFHRWLALPRAERDAHDLTAFRTMLHSGAPCPVETKRGMIDWLGPVLLEFYGSSESSIITTIRSEEWLEHPGSVGRGRPGLEVRIMDESGDDLPPGEPGLIHASGTRAFTYHGDQAKTAASWRGEYYAPGDIGFLDEDGWLYMCDRRTDMILSGGVNIYPAEIEGELLQHPAVADAVVIGVPDAEWGNRVVALVSVRPGCQVTGEELEAHCRMRLAGYKCPRLIEFRDELPRTPAGKMNRIRVREQYLGAGAGSPDAR